MNKKENGKNLIKIMEETVYIVLIVTEFCLLVDVMVLLFLFQKNYLSFMKF